ncbi:MAG TPA: HAMP domain-containing sensor histidine kinase [Prolixibacteraceae bacterium]|nr:HAMP domain-containing sensor histidine kinase [Prolixibacteraceae bacterium]
MFSHWSKEILEAALTSKTLAIALFDTGGKLLECNPAMKLACRGKPDGNFVNPTLSQMLESTREKPFRGMITFADESTNNYSIEGVVYQKEGELLVLGEVNVSQLLKQNVSMTLLNQQINNLQRQLIKEKKLLQIANQKLDKLNQEKNHFLGIAAHDLRSPMSVCYSFSDLILESWTEMPPGEILHYLELIRNQSQDAIALLSELLDVSAIEAGKIELKKEKILLNELVREASETHLIFAQKKQIHLTHSGTEKDVLLSLDRIRIRQVLDNLIGNALKYSPPETRVVVSLSSKDTDVVVSVKDEGPGIPAEALERIFQPFQTTQNKPTGNEKSTGLGLSIVQKIITEHGGSVSAESAPGKGSNFSFRLPLN